MEPLNSRVGRLFGLRARSFDRSIVRWTRSAWPKRLAESQRLAVIVPSSTVGETKELRREKRERALYHGRPNTAIDHLEDVCGAHGVCVCEQSWVFEGKQSRVRGILLFWPLKTYFGRWRPKIVPGISLFHPRHMGAQQPDLHVWSLAAAPQSSTDCPVLASWCPIDYPVCCLDGRKDGDSGRPVELLVSSSLI